MCATLGTHDALNNATSELLTPISLSPVIDIEIRAKHRAVQPNRGQPVLQQLTCPGALALSHPSVSATLNHNDSDTVCHESLTAACIPKP